MTTPAEDDPIEAQQEARPHRLGLGAKVSKQMKRRPSDDPLDQKLQAKFDAGRRKQARAEAECAGSSKNAGDESEDGDDESESKSQAFGKKRQNKTMNIPWRKIFEIYMFHDEQASSDLKDKWKNINKCCLNVEFR